MDLAALTSPEGFNESACVIDSKLRITVSCQALVMPAAEVSDFLISRRRPFIVVSTKDGSFSSSLFSLPSFHAAGAEPLSSRISPDARFKLVGHATGRGRFLNEVLCELRRVVRPPTFLPSFSDLRTFLLPRFKDRIHHLRSLYTLERSLLLLLRRFRPARIPIHSSVFLSRPPFRSSLTSSPLCSLLADLLGLQIVLASEWKYTTIKDTNDVLKLMNSRVAEKIDPFRRRRRSYGARSDSRKTARRTDSQEGRRRRTACRRRGCSSERSSRNRSSYSSWSAKPPAHREDPRRPLLHGSLPKRTRRID